MDDFNRIRDLMQDAESTEELQKIGKDEAASIRALDGTGEYQIIVNLYRYSMNKLQGK